MKILIRRRFWPKIATDWFGFLFILSVIPLYYWYIIFVALAEKYPIADAWYVVHFIFGTFLMFNITSNFVAVVLVDTSTKYITYVNSSDVQEYCEICCLAKPMRSWHCSMCNVCVLKRDHHCTFSGCCVGHLNHRYFIMFLIYFFVGCIYAAYWNYIHIWPIMDLGFLSILRIVCPLILYFIGVDTSLKHCLMILFVLNIVGVIVSSSLLYYHVELLLNGIVCHEKRSNRPGVNLGVKYNIVGVFGRRWYLTWIAPFVKSDLIEDGIYWDEYPFPRRNIKFS